MKTRLLLETEDVTTVDSIRGLGVATKWIQAHVAI